MSGTRGPRTGRVPPHIHERVDRKRARTTTQGIRRPYVRRLFAALLGFLLFVIGFVLGRATASEGEQQAMHVMGSYEAVTE